MKTRKTMSGESLTAPFAGRAFVAFVSFCNSLPSSLLRPFAVSFLLLSASFSSAGEFTRIIEPVRFSSAPGDARKTDIARTRRILDRFQKAGFDRAIWTVDQLPEKEEDLKKWANACLQAFPAKPILALDLQLLGEPRPSSLEGRAPSRPPQSPLEGRAPSRPLQPPRAQASPLSPSNNVGGALRAATSPLSPISPAQLSAFLQHIAPHIHSILVNYDHLNNYEQRADLDKAVALLRSRIALARKACPKAFLWLRVDDHHAGLENMQKWAKALEGSVDGYCIYRWHEWNVRQEAQHVKAAAPLVKTGKPVLRGGFRYTCPRPRRGLEKDLAKNFRMRMAIYEKWIQERKYTGYTRRIGDGIPGAVNVNMSFLPPGNSMKE